MDDASRRLAQLARILSEGRPSGEVSATDPAEHHQIRLKRIQGLTAQLGDANGHGIDAVDAVAMRLVLDDYGGVVSQLRAAARERAAALGTLAAQLRTDRRLVDELLAQQREKQLASAVPSDQPRASRNPDT